MNILTYPLPSLLSTIMCTVIHCTSYIVSYSVSSAKKSNSHQPRGKEERDVDMYGCSMTIANT